MALMVSAALVMLVWCCQGDVMLGKDAARDVMRDVWFVLVSQLLLGRATCSNPFVLS